MSTEITSEDQKFGDELVELVEIVKENLCHCTFLTLKPRTDIEFLSKFVHLKKYNVDDSVTAICKYYNGLVSNLNKFDNLRVSQVAPVFLNDIVKVYNTNEQKAGTPIICTLIKNWDPTQISLEAVCLAVSFIFEEFLLNINFQQNGGIGIIDLSGLSFQHVRQWSYGIIIFLTKMMCDIYPLRITGLHYINAPFLFRPIFKIAEKFMPAKIRSRVKFHKDYNDLLEFLSPNESPKIFGGYLEENEGWDQSMVSNLLKKNPSHKSYWSDLDLESANL